MKSKITILIFVSMLIFTSDAIPDTIHLKNGRSMKGLIEKETREYVWLGLGVGTVKFRWEEIDKIDRSNPEDTARIRQEWQKQNMPVKKEIGPKEVEFFKSGGHIFVNVLLNNKVNARFLLDTGAPSVLLSKRITRELGIRTQSLSERTTAVAGMPDLRVVDTVLNSIKVEGVEAKDVDAELALDEIPQLDADGLLGMGFLKKFKFQIDNVNKKLILEEKKSQNILEKTKYFSVLIPSDWETWLDEESLTIAGPNLPVKEGIKNAYITIKKNTDEQMLDYFETVRKAYGYFKNSPDLKLEMSEQLKKSFENSYSQDKYEPVSFDFEEKKDYIMSHMIYIIKTGSAWVERYEVHAIAKDGPVKAYNLSFICSKQYFDTYLPVFKTCLESFVINK